MTDDGPETDASPGAAGLPDAVTEVWEDVVADMEATAAEFRDAGWTVAEVHPDDVSTPAGGDGGRWGIDVLAPGSEFDELETMVTDGEGFVECEVYRGDVSGLVLLVVAMLDRPTDQAILFPAYYDPAEADAMLERARQAGEMRSHLRPPDTRSIVTFRHDDLTLFLPDD
jgi:hypothetical protein